MELFLEGNVAENGENFVEYILMLLAAMLNAWIILESTFLSRIMAEVTKLLQ